METFLKTYESLAINHELYLSIQHTRKGKWRVQILGKNLSTRGGDAELLCIEENTSIEALSKAEKSLERVKGQILTLEAKKKNVGY